MNLNKYLKRSAIATLLIQVLQTSMVLGTSILMARVGGEHDFGVYSLVFTWINILSIFAVGGFDDLLTRELPPLHDRQDYPKIKETLIWISKGTLLVNVLLLSLFAIVVNFTPWFGLNTYAWYFNVALLSVPMFVLMHTAQAAMRGLHESGRGQTAEKIIKPLVILLALLLFYALGWILNDALFTLVSVLSFAVAAAVSCWILFRFLKQLSAASANIQPSEISVLHKHTWPKACLYFAFLGLLQALATRTDILFLGNFYPAKPELVGYYNVALKFAEFTLIPFVMMNTISAPLFAQLHAEGRHEELQAVYTRTTRWQFILTIPAVGFFFLFGPYVTNWLYGAAFTEGTTALYILCAGQLFYAFFGPAGYLLMMTGYERQTAICLSISLAIAVGVHIWLIPLYGMTGAAIGTVAGYVVYKAALTWTAYKKLGLKVGSL